MEIIFSFLLMLIFYGVAKISNVPADLAYVGLAGIAIGLVIWAIRDAGASIASSLSERNRIEEKKLEQIKSIGESTGKIRNIADDALAKQEERFKQQRDLETLKNLPRYKRNVELYYSEKIRLFVSYVFDKYDGILEEQLENATTEEFENDDYVEAFLDWVLDWPDFLVEAKDNSNALQCVFVEMALKVRNKELSFDYENSTLLDFLIMLEELANEISST